MDFWQMFCNIIVAFFAALSFVLSLIAFANSGRKFELTHAERELMMRWYSETMDCLMALKIGLSSNGSFDKNQYLTKLSSLIEQGRFSFPNSLDGTGKEKYSAFRGTRDFALDMLVFYYDICNMPNANENIEHLANLERAFTSRVFDVVNPREYMKQVAKVTFLKSQTDEDKILQDFLASDPLRNDYWDNLK